MEEQTFDSPIHHFPIPVITEAHRFIKQSQSMKFFRFLLDRWWTRHEPVFAKVEITLKSLLVDSYNHNLILSYYYDTFNKIQGNISLYSLNH